MTTKLPKVWTGRMMLEKIVEKGVCHPFLNIYREERDLVSPACKKCGCPIFKKHGKEFFALSGDKTGCNVNKVISVAEKMLKTKEYIELCSKVKCPKEVHKLVKSLLQEV